MKLGDLIKVCQVKREDLIERIYKVNPSLKFLIVCRFRKPDNKWYEVLKVITGNEKNVVQHSYYHNTYYRNFGKYNKVIEIQREILNDEKGD